MKICVVTGCSGLIGSEAVEFFHNKGFKIVGIDNNFRKKFFGNDGSTLHSLQILKNKFDKDFSHYSLDICSDKIKRIFDKYNNDIKLIVHCAAQPSHDWAKFNPSLDFNVNAYGTLNLLEATRVYSKKAIFIHMSTNKVYGDSPNYIDFKELKTRFEPKNPIFRDGINESQSIDNSTHSLFGCSKLAADIYAQEYARYFRLKTGIFRGGCLTGPNHSSVKLHGFLNYLTKSILTKNTYNILGYKGKQVRDNIHSKDLLSMLWEFFKKPLPGEVFNVGGGKYLNCSIIEAIYEIEKITGVKAKYKIHKKNRIGDHKWYISDLTKFEKYYPKWKMAYNLTSLLTELIEKIKI